VAENDREMHGLGCYVVGAFGALFRLMGPTLKSWCRTTTFTCFLRHVLNSIIPSFVGRRE